MLMSIFKNSVRTPANTDGMLDSSGKERIIDANDCLQMRTVVSQCMVGKAAFASKLRLNLP
jgi:hypothetical protein